MKPNKRAKNARKQISDIYLEVVKLSDFLSELQPVSYTHLDVYKRQQSNAVPAVGNKGTEHLYQTGICSGQEQTDQRSDFR